LWWAGEGRLEWKRDGEGKEESEKEGEGRNGRREELDFVFFAKIVAGSHMCRTSSCAVIEYLLFSCTPSLQ